MRTARKSNGFTKSFFLEARKSKDKSCDMDTAFCKVCNGFLGRLWNLSMTCTAHISFTITKSVLLVKKVLRMIQTLSPMTCEWNCEGCSKHPRNCVLCLTIALHCQVPASALNDCISRSEPGLWITIGPRSQRSGHMQTSASSAPHFSVASFPVGK